MPGAAEIVGALAPRLQAALADAESQAAQAGLDERIAIRVDGASVGLIRGRAGYEVTRPAPEDASVVLRLTADAILAATAGLPPPGHHSVTALRRAGHLGVEGDPAAFARSLHLLERVLEVLRGSVAARDPAPPAARDLALLQGRYHRLASAQGGEAEVYAESAGAGPPVLFLHTAGADSRQYQGLLADVALARDWRLHAFDLPLHGRSMPPAAWDGGRYVLTGAAYAGWCVAFLEQVVGAPAVVVGCSMGAAMALVLAASRPDLVRGVVALEAPFRASGRLSPYLAHAAVNASVHNAAYVRGLMAPSTPERARRAAAWIYAQGGPGVYAGDLVFYSEEFDGEAVARRIDGERCPVAFLTGAYDYSAPPDHARQLAALIRGATVQIMPELGHFPMVEDPDRLRAHLAPALERVGAPARSARP
jgi:pimeloyl-ACP methyl ester carboxylesterase